MSSLLSRRRLLGAAVATAAVGFVDPVPAVSFAPRSVSLYNVHTGEWLRTVYWADGHYIREAVRDINWILRDHHSDEIRPWMLACLTCSECYVIGSIPTILFS